MHRILTPWIDFMFRKFGEPSVDDQAGQGRKRRRELTATEATWLVLLADVAVNLSLIALVWRAFQ